MHKKISLAWKERDSAIHTSASEDWINYDFTYDEEASFTRYREYFDAIKAEAAGAISGGKADSLRNFTFRKSFLSKPREGNGFLFGVSKHLHIIPADTKVKDLRHRSLFLLHQSEISVR